MRHHIKVLGALLAVVGLAAFCVIGCAPKRPGKPSAEPSAPKAAATWETPTDQECRQFAESLEQIVLSGDVAAFNDAIDWDAILDSATGGIEGVETTRRDFMTGAKKKILAGGMAHQMAEPVARGGHYRLLHVHTVGGEKRVLFRFVRPEGGVSYYDLMLARQADGKTRAVDIYVFVSAETMSKSLRRGFLPLAAEESKSVLAKLTGEESDLVKNAGNLQQMARSLQSGRHQAALDIYRRLPSSLKRDKNVLLMRLRAAAGISHSEYEAAIKAFRSYHRDDPCVDIISIDGYILSEKYDEARASVDRLDKAVGGDPYLNVFRANISLREGELETARELATKVIDADEALVGAYWTLVSVSLREKDFDETNRLLNAIDEKFQVEFFDLKQLPDYAEYVKSPQYQQWLKSRSPGGQ